MPFLDGNSILVKKKTPHPTTSTKKETPPSAVYLLFSYQIINAANLGCLDGSVVGDRSQGLGLGLLDGNGSGVSGHGGLALEEDLGAVGLGLALLCGVGLDAGQELLARARVADVLDADVDALLDVAVADLAVEDDADG